MPANLENSAVATGLEKAYNQVTKKENHKPVSIPLIHVRGHMHIHPLWFKSLTEPWKRWV